MSDPYATISLDSERHGPQLRNAKIGEEVRITIIGRVAKLEADMIDVSDYGKQDTIHGRVVTTVVITQIAGIS